ncbi:uncharacterized protein [Clytia hemisphaerica]|uniref:G-protein coupled receptors family 1 profile domain-containing protein n=1 Tax=Clytia hemisphaerica TaxID=252671 RepID=A0A7M5XMH6_9CNID
MDTTFRPFKGDGHRRLHPTQLLALTNTLLPRDGRRTPPPRQRMEDQEIKRSFDLAIGLIVALLNVAEIIMILRIQRKKKIFELVLLSLSFSDLLFGLSNGAICVVFLGKWRNEEVLEVTTSIYFLFILCSIFHLVFIALDRLWAIVRPIKHNIFMTRKKVYIILSMIWMLGIVVTLSLYYTNDEGHLFQDQYEFELVEDEDDNHNTTTAPTNTTLTPLSTITTAPPITIHHIISNVTDGGRNRTKRPRTTRQPPSKKPPQFRKKLLADKIQVFKKFMRLLLSGFILGADILLVLIYSLIMYRVRLAKKKAKLHHQQKTSHNKVNLVCVFVAGSFIMFTVPYALNRIITGEGQFWVNVILVSNSGMNSIIYFFRNRCEEEVQKKRKKEGVSSSSGLTPATTPLSSRHHINLADSVDTTPVGTPKQERIIMKKI